MLEDQHEIIDEAYLNKIRTGTVTYAEVFCANNNVTLPSALNLADAINATNSLTAFNFPVSSQEPGALSAIFQALSHCPKLSHLYLAIRGKNTLTESDVDSFIQIITNCTSLTILDISYMQLAHDQQLKIIQACSQSRSLNTLLLSEWNPAPQVIPELGRLLETSSTLKCLWLHKNGLTPNELSVLLKCLAKNKNPMLEELALGSNPIGPIGLASLATYIQSHKIIIKSLDIGLTSLDDSSADALFEIIYCNSPLESLVCSHNEFGFNTLTRIAKAIQNNQHMIKLDLRANDFHGNQRLAAVPNMSDVPQSSAQLLQQIDVKLSSNKQNQASQNQDLHPKL